MGQQIRTGLVRPLTDSQIGREITKLLARKGFTPDQCSKILKLAKDKAENLPTRIPATLPLESSDLDKVASAWAYARHDRRNAIKVIEENMGNVAMRRQRASMGQPKLRTPKEMHTYKVVLTDPSTRRSKTYLVMSPTRVEAPHFLKWGRFEDSIAAQLHKLIQEGGITRVMEERKVYKNLFGKETTTAYIRLDDIVQMPSFKKDYAQAYRATRMEFAKYKYGKAPTRWKPLVKVTYVKRKRV